MWQALRLLSDHAMVEHMQKRPSILGKGIPSFYTNSHESLTKANVNPKILDRVLKSVKLQIIQQEQDFSKSAQSIASHQQEWIACAELLSAQYKEERAKNIKLVS
jgi:hypothetical protein